MKRLAVSDTGPLRYLVQIEQIELLPRLFETILISSVVQDELYHPSAPTEVRTWITSQPGWIEVCAIRQSDDPTLNSLDEGEKSTIVLGLFRAAGLVLMDDRRGAAIARAKGFEVTGTLGILDLAAQRGMIDLAEALARLGKTNFRQREGLFEALLRQHQQSGDS